MIGSYEHGVWLVDLAPLGDPGLVLSAVATVLGLEIRTEDPLPSLVAGLRDKRMLLMLDNCEHVIDAAAGLAAAVLNGAPGVNILATSREPLGVAGERVYRLGPLSSPEPSSGLTAAEAAAFPAVQLFVERVTAIVEDFALTDANARLVVAICRRLDGLPLAIEFAAPRVEALGVEGLAARLDDSLPLLGAQRRAAMPRHRTMQAVIDWSYGLLSEDEQRFFRALGIFSGGFTVEAAAAVVVEAAKPASMRSTAWPIWWRNRWSSQMSAAPARGSGCSTRPAPSRSRNLTRAASVSGSRAATPSITAVYSSAPKGKSRRGLRANGWPTTPGKSTTCAQRSIGRFRQRRYIDRGGADRRRGSALDTTVAARGVPKSRQAGA